jgi:hypothetical protein
VVAPGPFPGHPAFAAHRVDIPPSTAKAAPVAKALSSLAR